MPYVEEGQKFNRLTALSDVNKSYERIIFRCECGNEKEMRAVSVVNGQVKSCGCLRNERISETKTTHGMSQTILYSKWLSMRNRCYTQKADNYQRYGGRGIKVCNEWKESFENFRDWALLNGFNEKLTIDRIDFNGNYCPENCRWITAFDQAANSRKAVILEAFGEKKHIHGWLRDSRCEVARTTLFRRLKKGIELEKALIK